MTATHLKPLTRDSLASQTRVLRRNLQTPIPAPRIALERKISIRFPHFKGFLTEYSSNLSITGMFIRARFPQRPGTILDFEFSLNDELKLIRGTGEVIWARKKDEGPELPAGMGIRFLRLDADSRRLIRWAVEKQIDEGAVPFDLEAGRKPIDAPELEAGHSRPEGASESLQPRLVEASGGGKGHPYAGYAVARRNLPRQWLLLAGATLVILAALLWWSPGGEPATATARAERPREAAGDAARASLDPPGAYRAAEVASAQLTRATEAWARAWAEQRTEDYLSCYSQRFLPSESVSREQWAAQRRARIEGPDFIQVAIRGLEAELVSPDRGRVSFEQTYRSDSYRDVTRKTLELVREDGRWLILEERSAPS